MQRTVGETAAVEAARAAKPSGAGAVRPARRMASESLLTGPLSQARLVHGRGGRRREDRSTRFEALDVRDKR